MFITDQGDQLVNRMEKGAAQREAYRNSSLLPSHVSRRLAPLDEIFLSPTVHFYLYPILWILYAISVAPSIIGKILWTRVVWFHIAWYWLLTWWRIRMVTPLASDGNRLVKGKEFACSHRISLSDVKTVQKAFGKPSVDAPGKQHKSSAENPDHVTVNHVFVAIMSEVATDQLSARYEEQGEARLGRFDSRLPQRISVFIPMSLREVGDWTTGNIVTGAIAFLPQAPPPIENQSDPTAERSPEQVHQHIHATKKELKLLTASWVPKMVWNLIRALGHSPVLMPYAALQMTPFPVLSDVGAVLMTWALRSLHGILTKCAPLS